MRSGSIGAARQARPKARGLREVARDARADPRRRARRGQRRPASTRPRSPASRRARAWRSATSTTTSARGASCCGELMGALVADLMPRLHAVDADDGADFFERQRAGLLAYLEYLRANPAYVRLADEIKLHDPELYRRAVAGWVERMTARIRAGIAQGTLRPMERVRDHGAGALPAGGSPLPRADDGDRRRRAARGGRRRLPRAAAGRARPPRAATRARRQAAMKNRAPSWASILTRSARSTARNGRNGSGRTATGLLHQRRATLGRGPPERLLLRRPDGSLKGSTLR